MPEKKQVYRPSRSYLTTLKIKGVDYSGDLVGIRIASSLASAYQVVDLFISIAPKDVLINKLYGEDDIKLEITLVGQTEFPQESMKFDLMLVTSDFQVPVSSEMVTGTQADRTTVRLLTIPRKPFITMTSFINAIYGIKSLPKNPIEVVQAIVADSGSGAELIHDTDGINPNKIRQIVIPPCTVYKAIGYVDNQFGLYNGAPVTFCQYDNRIHVMNLSSRMKKAATFSITHLSLDGKDQQELMTKKVNDGKHFYTTDNIKSSYDGNTMFGVLGKSLNHIVCPDDALSHTITQDLETVCGEYGVISQNKQFHINNGVANRKTYYINNTGYGKTEQFANSMIAKKIFNLAKLNMSIERNIIINNLLKVGECVRFISNTAEHKDITQKYILFNSDIQMTKQGEWQATASIQLVRTNKII